MPNPTIPFSTAKERPCAPCILEFGRLRAQRDCYTHCFANPSGSTEHEHDGEVVWSFDGGTAYADTHCRWCGQSGGLPLDGMDGDPDPNDVQWE